MGNIKDCTYYSSVWQPARDLPAGTTGRGKRIQVRRSKVDNQPENRMKRFSTITISDSKIHLGSLQRSRLLSIEHLAADPNMLRSRIRDLQEADIIVFGSDLGLLDDLAVAEINEAVNLLDYLKRDGSVTFASTGGSGKTRAIDRIQSLMHMASEKKMKSFPFRDDHLRSIFRGTTDNERLLIFAVPMDEIAITPGDAGYFRRIFDISKSKEIKHGSILNDIPPIKGSDLRNWIDWIPQSVDTHRTQIVSHCIREEHGQVVGLSMLDRSNNRIVIVPDTEYLYGPEGFLSGIIANHMFTNPNSGKLATEMEFVADCIDISEKVALGGRIASNSASWMLCCREVVLATKLCRSEIVRDHILLVGPTGSGKERIAHLVHSLRTAKNPSHDQAMITRHCGTLKEVSAVSSIFGHTKGAFTGATKARTGAVKEAHDSVLFLDEFQEMAGESGAVNLLFRFMQDEEYFQLGSEEELTSTALIIAATNSDTLLDIDGALQRSGLLPRFGAVIPVPGLLERWSDIPVLLEHFITVYPGSQTLDQDEKRVIVQEVLSELSLDEIQHSGVRALINQVARYFSQRTLEAELYDWEKERTDSRSQHLPPADPPRRGRRKRLTDHEIVKSLGEIAALSGGARKRALEDFEYKDRTSLRQRIKRGHFTPKEDKRLMKLLDSVFKKRPPGPKRSSR